MTQVRLLFYVLYIVLGIVVIARLLPLGLRWETLSGLIVGLALVALGVYRLGLYARLRGGGPR